MAVAKITGPGLISIAILVALLWACALTARATVRHADAETTRTLEAMRGLERKARHLPAAIPLRPPRFRVRAATA